MVSPYMKMKRKLLREIEKLREENEKLRKENEQLRHQLEKHVWGEPWEQEYWDRFEDLSDRELIRLARACLDRGDFENAKDVLSEIQRRHPHSEVRDDLSEINSILNRIYENLKIIESVSWREN